MRIVSLLPSATEIICGLGLAEQLVGVTHECDWPPEVRARPKVTRTHIPIDASSRAIDELVRGRLGQRRALYTLDFQTLRTLQPDLLVTQTLCDVCAVDDAEVQAYLDMLLLNGPDSPDGTAGPGAPGSTGAPGGQGALPAPPRVVYLEPTRLRDIYENIIEVGAAAGRLEQAKAFVAGLARRVEAVRLSAERALAAGRPRPRVVVLEWLDPFFSCGHWTPELVALAGGVEPLAQAGERSRRLTPEELAAARPEILVLACCGYSVEQTRIDLPRLLDDERLAGLPALRNNAVYLVDGAAYFSRPGPRLVDALEILAHLLAPAHHPLPPGLPAAERARVS